MKAYFDDWTDEELKRFKSIFGKNFEYDEFYRYVTLTQEDAEDAFNEEITFLKKDGAVYVECEEDRGMYEKHDNCIYFIEPTWWYKVDMEAILIDYANHKEIDPEEYKIY